MNGSPTLVRSLFASCTVLICKKYRSNIVQTLLQFLSSYNRTKRRYSGIFHKNIWISLIFVCMNWINLFDHHKSYWLSQGFTHQNSSVLEIALKTTVKTRTAPNHHRWMFKNSYRTRRSRPAPIRPKNSAPPRINWSVIQAVVWFLDSVASVCSFCKPEIGDWSTRAPEHKSR